MDTHTAWDWSALNDNISSTTSQQSPLPDPEPRRRQPPPQTQKSENSEEPRSQQQPNKTRRRRYGPRTCRICLDTVNPSWPNDGSAFNLSANASKPEYTDAELGRLLSPCKCKGSQRYVHEGCLNGWRLANPSRTRNYWQCPVCKFTYRFARLHWAAALSSRLARAAVTIVILILCVFTLGFVADPILDLWFDPVGTISETVTNVISDLDAQVPPIPQERTTWSEHFLKGFFSLGLVGFFKTALAMSPWHWLNMRGTGVYWSGRRAGTGRARMENVNLLFVLIGIVTFLVGIWKAVQAVSARLLKNVSDRVLDIGEDEDDDDDEPASAFDDESRKDE